MWTKKICVYNRKNVDVNKCKYKCIANVNVSVKQNDVMQVLDAVCIYTLELERSKLKKEI